MLADKQTEPARQHFNAGGVAHVILFEQESGALFACPLA